MFISVTSFVLLSYAVVVNGVCTWHIGDSIPIGTRCVIAGGAFHFQDDGNLVITNANGQTLWKTDTSGRGYLINFQSDGNVVMVNRDGNPVWQTKTNGKGGNYLQFQRDRNLVLSIDGLNGGFWWSGTHMNAVEFFAAMEKLETSALKAQQQLTSARNHSVWLSQQLSDCCSHC